MLTLPPGSLKFILGVPSKGDSRKIRVKYFENLKISKIELNRFFVKSLSFAMFFASLIAISTLFKILKNTSKM